VITGGPAPTRSVWGTVLYFLDGSTLTPVLRPALQPGPTPTAVLELLQAGPDGDERAVQLTSEVPTGLGPVTVDLDALGTAVVVVTTDVTTLSPAAVDQIVCTVRDTTPGSAPVTLTSGAVTLGPRLCPLTAERPPIDAAVPGAPPPR
jgi:hypothetical protein